MHCATASNIRARARTYTHGTHTPTHIHYSRSVYPFLFSRGTYTKLAVEIPARAKHIAPAIPFAWPNQIEITPRQIIATLFGGFVKRATLHVVTHSAKPGVNNDALNYRVYYSGVNTTCVCVCVLPVNSFLMARERGEITQTFQ